MILALFCIVVEAGLSFTELSPSSMFVHAIENGYEECQQTIKGAVEIETLSLNFWQSLYLTAFSSML